MKKWKLILSSGIANTFEWYDYALFGYFAPVIGTKFFPASDPSATLIYAFFAFALGYLMRPIGGIFFGIIGDKFGRKAALSTSIICMAVPTAIIGLLPTYETIGITATVLMIIGRMLQGLSMGGALTGSISFLIEHTPKNKRGGAGSVPMASICIGILLGSLAAYAVQAILTKEQFLDFGWRLPFLIGVLIMFVGFYIRKNMKETPLFEHMRKEGKIIESPLSEVIKKHSGDMFVSILINATGSVIFYLQATYIMNFLKVNRGFAEDQVNSIAIVCFIIMAFATVIAGRLSDRVGRRKIFVVLLGLIIATSPFIIHFFEHGDILEVAIAQVVLSIFAGAYIGPEPALQAEFYPTRVRNTALSVSYNLATSIFGGTTPLALAYLMHKTGSVSSCAYYIIGCALLSLVALCFYKDRSEE